MGPSIASRLVDRVRRPATALSSRELEVLQLVADGLSNKEIGRALFLSEATVKSHLVHVFQKLAADSRTAAVAAARHPRTHPRLIRGRSSGPPRRRHRRGPSHLIRVVESGNAFWVSPFRPRLPTVGR